MDGPFFQTGEKRLFSTQMERETRQILGRTFGGYKFASMTIAERIIATNKSAKGLKFKKYMKIMQEAYFKRVMKVFYIESRRLGHYSLPLFSLQDF